MDIAYGYEVQGRDDRKLDVAIRMTEFGNGTFLPGALLVNELPFRMSSSHFCAAYQTYHPYPSTPYPRLVASY